MDIEYERGVKRLGPAESCVLPAGIGDVRIVPAAGVSLVVCYVPDLRRDVVSPLRNVGHSDAEVRSLGRVDL